MLVDDLITRGVSEPYRMFTSRAEYRLTPVGREMGLVNDCRWRHFEAKREAVAGEQERLHGIFVRPGRLNEKDVEILGAEFQREVRAADLLRRPEFDYADVASLSCVGSGHWRDNMYDEQVEDVELQLEVQARYAGYIDRQQREIDKHAKQDKLVLPSDIDYSLVSGLSTEARQRLESARPVTLGHASRLEGVTPSTVSLLLIHLKKRQLQRSA